MAIAISLLALLATCYQLYLQRVHNEKSLKPLVQIDLTDRNRVIYVHVQNNGIGPFIIKKLTFIKDDKICPAIDDCLNLPPRSYQHIAVSETTIKVLQPGAYHIAFSTEFEEDDTDDYIDHVRQELSVITVKVEGRDVYDNSITVERDLSWFLDNANKTRHDYLIPKPAV